MHIVILIIVNSFVFFMQEDQVEIMKVFVSPTSILTLVITLIAMFLSTGKAKDFMKAFRYKTQTNLHELRNSFISIRLVMSTLLLTGAINSLILIMLILYLHESTQYIGMSILKSSATFLYSLVFVFALLPLKYKVKLKIIELEIKLNKNDVVT